MGDAMTIEEIDDEIAELEDARRRVEAELDSLYRARRALINKEGKDGFI